MVVTDYVSDADDFTPISTNTSDLYPTSYKPPVSLMISKVTLVLRLTKLS